MIKHKFLLPVFLGTLALGGCGNHGQSSAPDTQYAAAATSAPAASEVTTVIPEDQIQPLAPEALESAKLTGAACSLDTVDGVYPTGQLKLVGEKPHVFRGWVLDENKHPAGKFSLVLKGARSYAIPATTGMVRKDVGDFFKDATLTSAGFNISSMLSSVPAGDYSVMFIIQREKQIYYCDAKRNLAL